MKHKLSDIEMGMEFASISGAGEVMAYLSRKTGRIHEISEDYDADEDVPEDIQERDEYIEIPSRKELGLDSRIARGFAENRAPELIEDVREIFSRKGAYRRFEGLMESRGLMDAWHQYENERTRAALREWCEENGIELEEG